MAGALGVFILSIFSEAYSELWIESVNYLPNFINTFSNEFVQMLLLIVFGITYLLMVSNILSFMFKIFKKTKINTTVLPILVTLISMPIIMLAVSFGSDYITFSTLSSYMSKTTYYLLGAIPLYWVYEIIIAPIKRDTQKLEEKMTSLIDGLKRMNEIHLK